LYFVLQIRGPALGIGKLKRFLDMLAEDGHFSDQIRLPSLSHVTSLTEKDSGALNENVTRICKQTQCDVRIKNDSTSPSGKVVRIEGKSASKVLEAKHALETVLQFYYPKCFKTLSGVSGAAIPRLYQVVPLLTKYNVRYILL